MLELERVRMSWDEFLAVPDDRRAEWVDGEVLLMAPATPGHGWTIAQVILTVGPLFPDLMITTDAALRLPRDRVRAPDVMLVTPQQHATAIVESTPVLCVEVLSPSTRSEDTIRKSMEYAEGGVGQYWVVDPALRTVDVLANADGAWDVLARLDDDHPRAEVELAGVTVPLDLVTLLGPARD